MISKKMLVNMKIKILLEYTLPIIKLCQNKTNLENYSEAVRSGNTVFQEIVSSKIHEKGHNVNFNFL